MPKQLTKDLPVPLTDAEMAQRGQEYGNLCAKREDVQATLAQAKIKAEEELQRIGDRTAALAHILKARAEDRPVPIRLERDFGRGLVTTIRLDTNAVVDSEPMSEADRQTAVFGTEE